MYLGTRLTVPSIVNLPGQGGGGSAFEYTAIDNSFSMEFDGSSSYYVAGDIDTLNAAPSFTISTWIKPAVLPSTTRRIFSKYASNGDRIEIYIGGSSITFLNASGNNLSFRSQPLTTPAPANGWYHLAMVFDGSQTDPDPNVQNNKRLKTYIDTVPGTTLITGTQKTQTSGTISGKLAFIGCVSTSNTVGGGSGVFDGHIDEFAIFSQPLSEDTIQAIYDATINNPGKVADLNETPGAGPAAWYRMGD